MEDHVTQMCSNLFDKKENKYMALKKKPVTGMKDMMPEEMEIRDYVIGLIQETYKLI